MANLILSRDEQTLQRHRAAIITLALYSAKKAVKRQLQAQGLKVAHYSCRELKLMAEVYLDQHRAELLAEAKATVEQWVAEGFFGKRAQRAWRAEIESAAQTTNEPKSITSAGQNS